MSVNKYKPHVWIIPEDDANRQLVNGFLNHHDVATRSAQVMSPAGGWKKVRNVLEREYVPLLQDSEYCHVVVVIDFDEDDQRVQHFNDSLPEGVQERVFVIGSWDEPETLRKSLQTSLEAIGLGLATACSDDELKPWEHPQLSHNRAELNRLLEEVRPILFPKFAP